MMTSEDTRDLLRYFRERAAHGDSAEGKRLMLDQRTDLDDVERDELCAYYREQLARCRPDGAGDVEETGD